MRPGRSPRELITSCESLIKSRKNRICKALPVLKIKKVHKSKTTYLIGLSGSSAKDTTKLKTSKHRYQQ
jgi:hypothetical protein